MGELKKNEPLARYTSWRVGGAAKQFYKPTDLKDLSEFLKLLPEDENIVWLGLGSNVLIRDGGIDGTVIYTQGCLKQMTVSDEVIRAEAGVTCAKLAKQCAKLGLEKGAFFAGVPGTVGGALAMNAGAFGGETWPHVTSVEMINRKGEVIVRKPETFSIAYREVSRPADEWFVAGHFSFGKRDALEAKKAISDLLRERSEKQPIGKFSCGSVFRNPPNDYAARLIEAAGLKGFKLGGAQVSEKHANFIINEDKATAKDIERLIDHVAKQVEQKHGIKLEKEVHILGSL